MSLIANEVNIDPLIDFKGLIVILKPSKRKKIKKVRVSIKGALSIHNALHFKENIGEVFNDFDFVDFYLDEIDYLDLPFMQTLYHIKEYYAKVGKVVTIDSKFDDDLKKIIIRSGFENLMIKPKNV